MASVLKRSAVFTAKDRGATVIAGVLKRQMDVCGVARVFGPRK